MLCFFLKFAVCGLLVYQGRVLVDGEGQVGELAFLRRDDVEVVASALSTHHSLPCFFLVTQRHCDAIVAVRYGYGERERCGLYAVQHRVAHYLCPTRQCG